MHRVFGVKERFYNMKTITRSLKDINRIVTFGDSITYGVSASTREKCWANLVTSMLECFKGSPIELINKGIPASILCKETPAYEYAVNPCGLERLQTDIIDQRPDLVIIAYGFNDARGGTTPGFFQRDYQDMIDQIRAVYDPMIVAVNLYYMHEMFYYNCEHWDHSDLEVTEEFNLIIRRLAEKNGLIYADVYAAQKGIDWSVCEDHCHPNDLGYLLIANRIFEAIAANCVF